MCSAFFNYAGYLTKGLFRIKDMFHYVLSYEKVETAVGVGNIFKTFIPYPIHYVTKRGSRNIF